MAWVNKILSWVKKKAYVVKKVLLKVLLNLNLIHLLFFRSSRSQMLYKLGVLKHFAKVIKNTCVGGLQDGTLFTKRFQHRCFPINFENFLRQPIL